MKSVLPKEKKNVLFLKILESVIKGMPDAAYAWNAAGLSVYNQKAKELFTISSGEKPHSDPGSNRIFLNPETEEILGKEDIPFIRALKGESVVKYSTQFALFPCIKYDSFAIITD